MPENPKKTVDHEKLGRAVEVALVSDYIELLQSRPLQAWTAFLRGTLAGLGGVIGATVGVALLVAILHLFGGAPVIGQYFHDIGQTIQSGRK